MTVKLDLDLSAEGVEARIKAIKEQLRDLDDEIDLDFGIGDKLDELGKKLDEFGDSFVDDLEESIDRLEDLEVDVRVPEGGGDSSGDSGSDSGDRGPDFQGGWRDAMRRAYTAGITDSPESLGAKLDETSQKAQQKRFERRMRDFAKRVDSDKDWTRLDRTRNQMKRGRSFAGRQYGQSMTQMALGLTPEVSDDSWSSTTSDGYNPPPAYNIGQVLGGMKKRFRKLLPSVRTFTATIAAASPVLANMAVSAGGIAASFGAMAGAGAALIGLGLFGHGSTMASSMEQAKIQVRELKQDLFEVFQPTAQRFAPIQEQFFNFAPGEMERVAESMRGLTVYSDELFSLFRGGTQWLSQLVGLMGANETEVSELTTRFTRLLGVGILDFLQWMVRTAYENQTTFLKLIGIIHSLGETAWNLVIILTGVVSGLGWVGDVLSFLTNLLRNQFVVWILKAATAITIATYAGFALAKAIMFVARVQTLSAIPAIGGYIAKMQAKIFWTLEAIGVNYALAHSIATVATVATMGAAALLTLWTAAQAQKGMKMVGEMQHSMEGGPSGGGSWGGGSGQTTINNNVNYQIDVQGNADNTQVKALEDVVMDTQYQTDTRNPYGSGSEGVGTTTGPKPWAGDS